MDGSAPAEGGMGVHMPTLWDADPGIPKPGGAPVHVRHARLGSAGFNSWIRFSAQNPRQSSLLSKKQQNAEGTPWSAKYSEGAIRGESSSRRVRASESDCIESVSAPPIAESPWPNHGRTTMEPDQKPSAPDGPPLTPRVPTSNDEGHATDPPMGASAVKCW